MHLMKMLIAGPEGRGSGTPRGEDGEDAWQKGPEEAGDQTRTRRVQGNGFVQRPRRCIATPPAPPRGRPSPRRLRPLKGKMQLMAPNGDLHRKRMHLREVIWRELSINDKIPEYRSPAAPCARQGGSRKPRARRQHRADRCSKDVIRTIESVSSPLEFQLHAGTDRAQEMGVIKSIVRREMALSLLRAKCSQLTAGETHLLDARYGTSVLDVLARVRDCTVDVLQSIALWRRAFSNAAPQPYFWRRTNYMLKMTGDLDFVADVDLLVRALGVDRDTMLRNPLMLEKSLAEDLPPPDDGSSSPGDPFLDVEDAPRFKAWLRMGHQMLREEVVAEHARRASIGRSGCQAAGDDVADSAYMPHRFARAARELDQDGEAAASGKHVSHHAQRTVLRQGGASPLAKVADAVATRILPVEKNKHGVLDSEFVLQRAEATVQWHQKAQEQLTMLGKSMRQLHAAHTAKFFATPPDTARAAKSVDPLEVRLTDLNWSGKAPTRTCPLSPLGSCLAEAGRKRRGIKPSTLAASYSFRIARRVPGGTAKHSQVARRRPDTSSKREGALEEPWSARRQTTAPSKTRSVSWQMLWSATRCLSGRTYYVSALLRAPQNRVLVKAYDPETSDEARLSIPPTRLRDVVGDTADVVGALRLWISRVLCDHVLVRVMKGRAKIVIDERVYSLRAPPVQLVRAAVAERAEDGVDRDGEHDCERRGREGLGVVESVAHHPAGEVRSSVAGDDKGQRAPQEMRLAGELTTAATSASEPTSAESYEDDFDEESENEAIEAA